MSSICKTIALLVALAIAYLEDARPQTSAPQSAQDTARLTSEIRQAKPEAIVEAGDTHNPVFIKDLRTLRGSLETKEANCLGCSVSHWRNSATEMLCKRRIAASKVSIHSSNRMLLKMT